MKRCPGCRTYKSPSAFYKRTNRPDGLQSQCKNCHQAYRRTHQEQEHQTRAKYYQANRERELARVTEWRTNLRAQAIAHLGGKCQSCHADDPRVLQFDHIDGDGWSDSKKDATVFRAILNNDTTFQLLCANCHTIKTRTNNEYLRRPPPQRLFKLPRLTL